jgi:uncharacterized protein YoxC
VSPTVAWSLHFGGRMENWQLALVVISAILVGALIPAITQYRSTMRCWEKVVRDNESDIRHTMRELSQLSTRLNKMGSSIEANAKQVEGFFQAFDGITDSVKRLTGTVRTASVVGAAVAPAVAAAIRALQSSAQPADSVVAVVQTEKHEVGEQNGRA